MLRGAAAFVVVCAAARAVSAAPPAVSAGWTRLSAPGAIGMPICPRLAANGTLLALGMGMARSTDGGKTWTDASNGLERSTYDGQAEQIVTAAAVAGALVAVANSGTVYRSTDAGARWTVAARLTEGSRGAVSLAQESGRIHLLLEGHHYDSTDDGVTWNKMPGRIPGTLLLARNGKLWAAGRYGSFGISTDDGAHWQKPKRGLPKDSGTYFTGLAEDGGHLYAATTDGVFVSRDGGDSWRQVALVDNGLDVAGLLFVGTTLYVHSFHGLYRSERRGPWPKIYGDMRCPPVAVGDALYMTTESEILRSADRGTTWTHFGSGYGFDHVPRLAASASGEVVAAAANSVSRTFVSADGGHTFVAAAPSTTFRFALDGRTVMVAAGEKKPGEALISSRYLLRSEDAGANWMRLPVPGGDAGAGLPLAIEGRSVILAGDGVLLSSNLGDSWTRTVDGLPSSPYGGWGRFGGDALALFAGRKAIVSSEDGVFTRAGDGGAWKPIPPPLPPGQRFPQPHAVKALAAGGSDVYVIAFGRLCRWDGGATAGPDTPAIWTDLTARIPGVAQDSPLELMAVRGRRVLVATGGLRQTILLSEDRGASWRPLPEGLPPNRVMALAATDKEWLAGTMGAGIWQHP